MTGGVTGPISPQTGIPEVAPKAEKAGAGDVNRTVSGIFEHVPAPSLQEPLQQLKTPPRQPSGSSVSQAFDKFKKLEAREVTQTFYDPVEKRHFAMFKKDDVASLIEIKEQDLHRMDELQAEFNKSAAAGISTRTKIVFGAAAVAGAIITVAAPITAIVTIPAIGLGAYMLLRDKPSTAQTMDVEKQPSEKQPSTGMIRSFFNAIGQAISSLKKAATSEKTEAQIATDPAVDAIKQASADAPILAPKGATKIRILHGPDKNKTVDLKLTGPIKMLKNVQIPEMKAASDCLVMNKKDFEKIKELIHPNAFGSDYKELPDGKMLVWKYPADLNQIESLKLKEPSTWAVGTYGGSTKFRIDFPEGGTSVHHLQDVKDGKKMAVMSMGNLYGNFDAITTDERARTKQMSNDLEKFGIIAISMGHHHTIAFYEDKEGKIPLTPESFAQKLQGENGQAIIDILKAAASSDEKRAVIVGWAKNFIAYYGPQVKA